MTTFATDDTAALVLDARRRAAWAHYADTLRDLGDIAYAAAEPPAWEHLQEELTEIEPAQADASLGTPGA